MKKTVLYMVIIVVLSLAAGVVLGMGIGKKCGYARHLAFREGLGQPKDGRHGQEGSRRHALDILSRKLNLSEEQKGKIKGILDASRIKVDASRKEGIKNFTAIRGSTNVEIRALLTPEQQVEFDKLQLERKRRGALKTKNPE